MRPMECSFQRDELYFQNGQVNLHGYRRGMKETLSSADTWDIDHD